MTWLSLRVPRYCLGYRPGPLSTWVKGGQAVPTVTPPLSLLP